MWTRWTLAGRASLCAATFDRSFRKSLDTNKSSLPSQMLHKSFNNCPSLIGTILWIFILTFATSTYHLLPPPYASRCEGEFKFISCSQFHTTACAVEHPTDRFLASGQRWWVNQLLVLFLLLFCFIQFFSARIFGRIPNMNAATGSIVSSQHFKTLPLLCGCFELKPKGKFEWISRKYWNSPTPHNAEQHENMKKLPITFLTLVKFLSSLFGFDNFLCFSANTITKSVGMVRAYTREEFQEFSPECENRKK